MISFIQFLLEKAKTPPKYVTMSAKTWKDQDPIGWWMSIKYDGVRAYWDGEYFYSRAGNIWAAPGWLKDSMPKNHLDGEFFCGRDKFHECSGIARKKQPHEGWRKIKYYVFDLPDSNEPFETRMKKLEQLTKGNKNIVFVKQTKIKDSDHLQTALKKELALKGEGMMLRKPGSKYERKRSSSLLKIKEFFDAEAEIVGYTEGKDKYEGMVGAFKVKDVKNGALFNLSGFSDAMRKKPPKIGTIVTYKYQGYHASGKPRIPVFLRIRSDAGL